MANLSDKVQTFNSFVADNLTDWESFTPAFIGDDNCNLNATLSIFRRIGDSIEIILEAAPTGAGSASTDIFLELPNNLNGSAAAGAYLGPGYFRKDAATNELIPLNVLQSTNTRRIQFLANFPNRAGEGALEDRDFSNVSSSNLGDFIRLRATIPITEYANSGSALVGFAQARPNSAGLTWQKQYFQGIDETGLSNNTGTVLGSSGNSIDVKPGTYLLTFGGFAKVTESSQPNYCSAYLTVWDGSSTIAGVSELSGISEAAFSGTFWGGQLCYREVVTISSDKTLKLRGAVNTQGGTVTSRDIVRAYLIAERIA